MSLLCFLAQTTNQQGPESINTPPKRMGAPQEVHTGCSHNIFVPGVLPPGQHGFKKGGPHPHPHVDMAGPSTPEGGGIIQPVLQVFHRGPRDEATSGHTSRMDCFLALTGGGEGPPTGKQGTLVNSLWEA